MRKLAPVDSFVQRLLCMQCVPSQLSEQLSTFANASVLMIIVHVFVHVNSDAVDAFTAATQENARNSIAEPGVIRFDLIQQEDDATQFLLIEIYRTPADTASHKETAHYAKWRDAVAPMMAEPRRSLKYKALFPEASEWDR